MYVCPAGFAGWSAFLAQTTSAKFISVGSSPFCVGDVVPPYPYNAVTTSESSYVTDGESMFLSMLKRKPFHTPAVDLMSRYRDIAPPAVIVTRGSMYMFQFVLICNTACQTLPREMSTLETGLTATVPTCQSVPDSTLARASDAVLSVISVPLMCSSVSSDTQMCSAVTLW